MSLCHPLGGLGNLHWRLIALFIARYSPVPLLMKPTLIPLDPDKEAAKMVSVHTTLTGWVGGQKNFVFFTNFEFSTKF